MRERKRLFALLLGVSVNIVRSADEPVPLDRSTEPAFRLMARLFDGHNPSVRPLRDQSRPVKVSLKMNLYQILAMDEADQVVRLYVWMTQRWRDEYLGWDPQAFDGVDMITVPAEKVWSPDTCLYNNLEMEPIVTERITNVNLHANGNSSADLTLRYPALYKVSCKMDIRFFPFDVQNCTLVFGSWAFHSRGIDYEPEADHVLNESFVSNQEWELLSFKVRKLMINYSCCRHPFSELRMDLVVYRKSLYYLMNLVVPQAIISIVATVGIFTPSTTTAQRSEKVNLGITTLLAMSILLLMVSDKMPTTSLYVPLISVYFLLMILLISLSTITSSLIILLQRRGEYNRSIPAWVRTVFFNFLGPWLHVKPPKGLQVERYRKARRRDKALLEPLLLERFVSNALDSAALSPRPSAQSEVEDEALSLRQVLLRNFRLLSSEMRKLDAFVRLREAASLVQLEYEYLASILDRLCLLLFLVANALVTGSFLLIGYVVAPSQLDHRVL